MAEIRNLFGDKWDGCQDVAFEVIELILKDELGPDARIKRRGMTFVVLQPGLLPAKARANAIGARKRVLKLFRDTEAIKLSRRKEVDAQARRALEQAVGADTPPPVAGRQQTATASGAAAAARVSARRARNVTALKGAGATKPSPAESSSKEKAPSPADDGPKTAAASSARKPSRRVGANAVSRTLKESERRKPEPEGKAEPATPQEDVETFKKRRAGISDRAQINETRRLQAGIAATTSNLLVAEDRGRRPDPGPPFPPPETKFMLSPMWVARSAAMISMHCSPYVPTNGEDIPLTTQNVRPGKEAEDLIELDLLQIATMRGTYQAVVDAIPCNALTLPVHQSSLYTANYPSRLEQALKEFPEEIRRTMVIEIVDANELAVNEEVIKRSIGMLKMYARGVIARVPFDWTNFSRLAETAIHSIGVNLINDDRPISAISVDSEIFARLAKKAGMTSYAVGLTPPQRNAVKDAGFDIFEGRLIDMQIVLTGGEIPPEKIDFLETMIESRA